MMLSTLRRTSRLVPAYAQILSLILVTATLTIAPGCATQQADLEERYGQIIECDSAEFIAGIDDAEALAFLQVIPPQEPNENYEIVHVAELVHCDSDRLAVHFVFHDTDDLGDVLGEYEVYVSIDPTKGDGFNYVPGTDADELDLTVSGVTFGLDLDDRSVRTWALTPVQEAIDAMIPCLATEGARCDEPEVPEGVDASIEQAVAAVGEISQLMSFEDTSEAAEDREMAEAARSLKTRDLPIESQLILLVYLDGLWDYERARIAQNTAVQSGTAPAGAQSCPASVGDVLQVVLLFVGLIAAVAVFWWAAGITAPVGASAFVASMYGGASWAGLIGSLAGGAYAVNALLTWDAARKSNRLLEYLLDDDPSTVPCID